MIIRILKGLVLKVKIIFYFKNLINRKLFYFISNCQIIKHIKKLLKNLICEFINLLNITKYFLETLGTYTHGMHQRFKHGLTRFSLGASWLNFNYIFGVTLDI